MTDAEDSELSKAAEDLTDLPDLGIPLDVQQRHFLALALGFNELAKATDVLGEKLYWRMASAQAVEALRKVGGDLKVTENRVLMTLRSQPLVKLYAHDIELMRKVVEEFDRDVPEGVYNPYNDPLLQKIAKEMDEEDAAESKEEAPGTPVKPG